MEGKPGGDIAREELWIYWCAGTASLFITFVMDFYCLLIFVTTTEKRETNENVKIPLHLNSPDVAPSWKCIDELYQTMRTENPNGKYKRKTTRGHGITFVHFVCKTFFFVAASFVDCRL